MKTVVSMFDDLENARDCVDDLVDNGFAREDISLITRDVSGEYVDYIEAYDADADLDRDGELNVGATAAGGAVIGGIVGLLIGTTSLAIPGLGALVVAGPLASALAGAATGALAGGLLGALVEWGVPEVEAEYYTEGVRRGSTLVALKVADEYVEDAVAIMNDHDPVNIERRAEFWRSEENWTGYDAEAEPYSRQEIEEYQRRREEWHAPRSGGDDGLLDFDDDEYDVPYSRLEPRFRSHYNAYFANDRDWTIYAPAYRYGYLLAIDPEYSHFDWHDIERDSDLHSDWENYGEGPWQEFKDAIEHAWKETKASVQRIFD